MNTKKLLDSLLSSGQSMTQSGKQFFEEKAGIPEDSNQRSAMLSGMGKGALAAGALALLLGNKKGRKLAGGALKIGSVAALGGLAYKAYQSWQKDDSNTAQTGNPQISFSTQETSAREQKILQALIMAAKADGHIDDSEQEKIEQFMNRLGDNPALQQFVHDTLSSPVNPQLVAADIQSAELASEVYLVTRATIDPDNFMEKSYLDELTRQLNLTESLVQKLDEQLEQA